MIWLITVILVTVPSVSSTCGGEITLSISNPETAFQTPNYLGYFSPKIECSWTVSAPVTTTTLQMSCYLHTPITSCNEVSLSVTTNGNTIRVCSHGTLSRPVYGSSVMFTFKRNMENSMQYSGMKCVVSYEPKVITTTTAPVNTSCACGQKGGQRIVGGNEATPNEYPWQVLVMFKSTRFAFCGGSVIAREWVLSASHCFDRTTNTSNLVLILGEHNKSTDDSISQDYDVKEVIKHIDYRKPAGLVNDIALIKVAKPITFNPYISPICLPFNYKKFDFTNQIGITSGWGRTIPSNYSSSSKVLKEIEVKLIMSSTCDNHHGYGWSPSQVNENMICGIAHNGSSCHGDSGGPLIWKSPTANHYFLLGIVSLGSSCASKIIPTVYTFVPKYIDWIAEITGVQGEICHKQ